MLQLPEPYEFLSTSLFELILTTPYWSWRQQSNCRDFAPTHEALALDAVAARTPIAGRGRVNAAEIVACGSDEMRSRWGWSYAPPFWSAGQEPAS
jgi:hypothetical protein